MTIRLNKYIANMDIASRREADRLIQDGKVIVNGKIETNPAYQVSETDTVAYTFDITECKKEKVSIKLYKPKGYVVSTNDKEGIPLYKLTEKIPGVHPVGRLDKDSVGLIILTNDGVMHKKIIGVESICEKEYYVKVVEKVEMGALKKLEHGLYLDGMKLKKAKIKKIDENSFFITITEGRNRQIRRMCRIIGYNVIVLKRIRIGNITLGNLKEGEWKHLNDKEIEYIYSI